MQKLKDYNDQVTFLLLKIDCFSRVIHVQPLLRKTAEEMVKALKKIYPDPSTYTLRAMSDEGKEFLAAPVQRFFRKRYMEFYTAYGNTKASFAEKAIQFLKHILWRYMTYNHTFRYIDDLQLLVQGYNNRPHRSIGMAPAEVNEKNAHEVFIRLYGNPWELLKKSDKTNKSRRTRYRYPFKVSDTVRVQLKRTPFSKGFDQNYSTQIYRVAQRLRFMNPVQYKLETLEGDSVRGKYYPQEMIHATPRENELYEIEKIVDRRTRNRRKEVKVRWKNFPPSYDQWIFESDLQDLPGLWVETSKKQHG